MKELKDYLHLYPTAEIVYANESNETVLNWYIKPQNILVCENYLTNWDEVKVLLRPLSSMTEEEKDVLRINVFQAACLDRFSNEVMWTFEQVKFLLAQNFDIFNLIPAGLAIDAKTLK